MALSSTNVLDVRVGGSDTANGGAFDPLNANMATNLAATSATGASPVVTSASYNFISRDVGAWLYIKSGTNWTAGWYQIASVASNAATLSAAAGAGYLAGDANQPASPGVTTAAGCATVASPTGGTWTIDYSQGTSPGIAYTDLVIGATTTQYTSAGNPVGPNVVGNVLAVTSGTGFTVQRVQISSVSGTTATCDKSLGTAASTGGVGGLGGCLATPGMATGLMVAGLGAIMIKANGGSPDFTFSASSNVSGGKCTVPAGTSGTTPNIVCGWNTTRTVTNTDATRPTFKPSANSVVMFYSGGQNLFRQLNFVTPGFTSCEAIQADNAAAFVERCRWDGYNHSFYVTFGTASYWTCEIKAPTNGFANAATAIHNCTVNGGGNNGTAALAAGILEDNIVTGFNGPGYSVTNNTMAVVAKRNVAYGLTGTAGSGFVGAANFIGVLATNVAWSCAAYGYDLGGGAVQTTGRLFACAAGSCGTANFRTPLSTWNGTGLITLTVDPFADAAGLDFSPNVTAGGGILLRAAGWPSSWPGFATASYSDSGAAQHEEVALPVSGSICV